jgi:hypothetical protein
MANPEQALWRAVIEQAIKDACGKLCEPNDQRNARDWLLQPNRNFSQVCALADLEPDYVRKLAREAIEAYAHKINATAKREPKPKRARMPRGTLFEHNGRALTLPEWARQIGCSKQMLYWRIASGWTIEAALTTNLQRAA